MRAVFSIFLVLLCSVCFADSTTTITNQIDQMDLACPSMKKHIGASLLFDTCWSAMFPIEVGDITIVPGHEESNPNEEDSAGAFCCCKGLRQCSSPDDYITGDYGWVWKWWEIDRIVEVVRVPWCFPSLGGADGLWGFWLPHILTSGWAEVNKTWGGFQATGVPEELHHFYNVHFYSYAPLALLELLISPECHAGLLMDFDLLEASEFDFFWARDGFAWFEPEVVLFANPIAAVACSADCAFASTGFGKNFLFWCAGCDGTIYPIKGHVNYNLSPVRVAELVLQKYLFKMFRTGKEFKTIGREAKCGPYPWPFFTVKDEFKLQMIHPMVEQGDVCVHPLGRSPFLWSGEYNLDNTPEGKFPGESATVAGLGEDYVYYLWRRMECCIR